ncbi:MAG: hypothetical protein ABJH07_25135 [Sedimentitalea sp.]|uniref:hypothetical protein n=1 Tax=Sedimentitalea sp. TaxID=2048915 RepID=UPI003266C2C7
MNSIYDTITSDTQNRFGPRSRPRMRTLLPEADHQRLQQHLQLCEHEGHPAWKLLAYVLRDKIMATEPAVNLHACDLVTGGCRVTYSVNGGESETGLLIHRARSGSGSGVVPVCSLLGATLIGMRAGQRAPLLCEDGTIESLAVLGVTPSN